MNLYIPEIGNKIQLQKSWTFKLHAEDRNIQLGSFFGYSLTRSGWIKSNKLPTYEEIEYEIKYPPRIHIDIDYETHPKLFLAKVEEYNSARQQAEFSCKEYQKNKQNWEECLKKMNSLGVDSIEVTIPKGTILKIDRIYIRKNASEFSNITFIAQNINKKLSKKVPKHRFWANLKYCNQIQFLKIEP